MLFYRAKHRTEKESDKLLRRIIITGVIFGAAIVCYSATVFAWFQAGLLNTGNTIKAARFSVLVTVKDETNNIVPPESNGSYALVKNTVYSITITGDGNAENGYCKISDGNNVTLYTANIQETGSITFSFVPETGGNYTFTACWGTAPEELITNGSEIGKKTDSGNDGTTVDSVGGIAGNAETGSGDAANNTPDTGIQTPAQDSGKDESGENPAGQNSEPDDAQDVQSGSGDSDKTGEDVTGGDTADDTVTGSDIQDAGQSDNENTEV